MPWSTQTLEKNKFNMDGLGYRGGVDGSSNHHEAERDFGRRTTLIGHLYQLTIVPGVLNSLPHLILTVAHYVSSVLQIGALRLREATNLG